METFFENKVKRGAIIRRLWFGGFSLLLAAILTAMAGSNTFAVMSANAKDTCERVAWYVRGGYWREDVKVCLTHIEHVLSPKSGAGAKLDPELDD